LQKEQERIKEIYKINQMRDKMIVVIGLIIAITILNIPIVIWGKGWKKVLASFYLGFNTLCLILWFV